MPLQSGTRVGGYEIVAPLAAGGMGEVYRARDTRLGRDVAIKILSPRIAADRDAVLRFEREARALATLNHPNIAAIYDVIESDGQPALVLELVDGQTLADRIAAGALSIGEASGYAKQLADALDVAHEAGIVHRDLKPANIKVTEDGRIKVLDFGLAKAVAAAAGELHEVEAANSPTITVHGTGHGVILGTAAYMSPEQARGKRVDKRTDVWAFGCVLFEMLTGQRAFSGETTSDVTAAIIERAPDLTRLPASTPVPTRRVIARCLEKDPKRRVRDIAEVRVALDENAAAAPPRSASRWPLSIAILAAGIGAGWLVAIATRGTAAPPAPPVIRTTLLLPQGVRLSRAAVKPITVAENGSAIAYIGERDAMHYLYVQRLDQAEAIELPGTSGAIQPFFSPDAAWVGYFGSDALQKVAVDGRSAPIRVTNVDDDVMGAAWGRDDTIVFTLRAGGLLRVNAQGGTPAKIPGVDYAAILPQWLPDGKSLLVSAGKDLTDIRAIAVVDVTGGAPRVLARLNGSTLQGPAVLGTGGTLTQAEYVDSGFIVFGQSPGAERAMAFDIHSMTLSGTPLPVADNLERGAASGAMYFAASRSGLMVSAPTGERHRLVWVDRSGRESPISDDERAFRGPVVSPDGKTVAVAANDETRRSDIWLYDATRGTRTRLTTSAHNLHPAWMRDGSGVLVTAAGIIGLPLSGGRTTIASVESQRGALRAGTAPYVRSVEADGALLAQANVNDIWRFTKAGKWEPLLVRDVDDYGPALSPDGHWLAHASTESGQTEVYVRRYPSLDGKVMVSSNGGSDPVWSRDGRELFYRHGDAVMAARVELGERATVAPAVRLFSGLYTGTAGDVTFDVAPDGRFVMVKSDPASELRRLSIVQNLLTPRR